MPATDSTQRSNQLSAIIQPHPRSNATARTDRHRIQRKTLHPCPCHRDTFFEQAHHAFPHHAIQTQAHAARRAGEEKPAIVAQQTPSQALEAQNTGIHCQRLTPVSNAEQMPLTRGIDPPASHLRLCVGRGKQRHQPIARMRKHTQHTTRPRDHAHTAALPSASVARNATLPAASITGPRGPMAAKAPPRESASVMRWPAFTATSALLPSSRARYTHMSPRALRSG